MYQAIFLDLDDTILDFSRSQAHAFERICHEIKFPFSSATLSEFIDHNLSLWHQLELQQLTKDELLRTRFSTFFAKFSIKVDGETIDQHFRHYLADTVYLVDGAVDFLETLKKQNIHIYASSNGVYDTQIARLSKANLLDYFDDLFISEKIGASKPDVLFFERALKQIENPPTIHTILMVGDSLTSDIQGANNFGMPVCWFNPKKLPLPQHLSVTHDVTSLQELLELLGITTKNEYE